MNGHYEMIVCPNCGSIEKARVENAIPFPIYIHDCVECGYKIQESEWQLYNWEQGNGKETD